MHTRTTFFSSVVQPNVSTAVAAQFLLNLIETILGKWQQQFRQTLLPATYG
jgi:hypothetical protein